jgi:hypothetical protein
MLDYLFPLLGQYAIQSPLLLVWIAGLVLALVRWQRDRRTAILIGIVCAISIVDLLIATYLTVMLPIIVVQRGGSAAQIGVVFGIIGAVRSALHAVLWAMVLFAVFGRRKTDDAATAGGWRYQPDPQTREPQ